MAVQNELTEFAEKKEGPAFEKQNSKLLKVRLGDAGPIQAKAGAMVAYQGSVDFEHAGSGGIGRMLKKAVSGEGQTLMKMTGSGEVFLADFAQDIHIVHLENDSITVNGANLLAFDADIDWDIKRVEGVSGMMGGGLFNTELKGTGFVAFTSDGPPVMLNPSDSATFADPQAAITWSSNLKTGIKTNVKLKDMVGRSSGESIQMSFEGDGWVLVQPSEGQVVGAATQGGGTSSAGGVLGGLLGN